MTTNDLWRSAVTAALTAAMVFGGPLALNLSGCGPSAPPGGSSPPTKPGDPPPKPPEPAPPSPAPDPTNAIGKLAMQGSYCSGTVVGPKRGDGRYTVVSAAHCFKRVGEPVTFIPRGGVAVQAAVVAIDRQSDCAILTTDVIVGTLAFVLVADATPPPGTPILHAGYGVHVPGNTERGQVLDGPNPNGQVRYRLSVSQGDSGGGIVTDESGRLLSPVCCTDSMARIGNVWGAAPEVVRRMIATPTDYVDLPPASMPPPPAVMPPPR